MALCYKEEHLRTAEKRVPTCLLSAHVHVSGKIDDGIVGLNLLTLLNSLIDLYDRYLRLTDKTKFNHESTDSKIIPADVKPFTLFFQQMKCPHVRHSCLCFIRT